LLHAFSCGSGPGARDKSIDQETVWEVPLSRALCTIDPLPEDDNKHRKADRRDTAGAQVGSGYRLSVRPANGGSRPFVRSKKNGSGQVKVFRRGC